MLSNNSLPFIESDAFVVQAQTDIVVLTGHDCTYLHAIVLPIIN
jgi:methionyl-tRNA synthetase